MIVYPAIDIRGGRCVRLVEGDFARETVYDSDPALAARRWTESGAEWLHVVDLDGAKEGSPVNRDTVARIRDAVSIPMQLGGGIRHLADIEDAFATGIDRIVLGTVALRDPQLVLDAVDQWDDRIAIALDARDGRLATDGWIGQTDSSAVDVARRLDHAGVRHFILTDIRRDGTLSGPNLEGLGKLVESVQAAVIASGGIATIADLEATAAAGASGTIVGRALYDGRIDLGEAIAAVNAAVSR